ncbi:MAG: DUF1565 domain-containing protein [Cyanobacteriota bacterium]|nr:DUF1565 domain-containing protein [Cyanobacteriota bacterium]
MSFPAPNITSNIRLTIENDIDPPADSDGSNARTRYFLWGLGLSALAVFASEAPVTAASSLSSSPQVDLVAQNQETALLYVDPDSGDDLDGSGRADAPFRTISHALEVVGSGGTIVLARGKYTIETGEIFPLRLGDGVTVRGDRDSRGDDIEIYGGGSIFESPGERRNVAVVASDEASLVGVTVTNPHDRGYGVWIESGSPRIVSNRFRKNPQDGIAVGGNSSPLIQDNEFEDNGTHGITIVGAARPDVRDNIFKKTGLGIYIAQDAAPLVIGNRITDNQDGVVVQQNGQPVLRGNLIADNDRYGLVAMAQSRANLGTPDDPGGNMIRDNGREDLHNSSGRATVAAFGNQVSPERTRGEIDFGLQDSIAPELPELELASASASPSAASESDGSAIPLTPNRLITLATPSDSKNSPATPPIRTPRTSSSTTSSTTISPPVAPTPPALSLAQPEDGTIELPSPNLSVSRQGRGIKPPSSPQSPQLLPTATSTPMVSTSSRTDDFDGPRSVSELVPELGPIPVPGPHAPIGDSGEVSISMVQPPGSYVPGMPPSPPISISQSSSQFVDPQQATQIDAPYRVVVDANSTRARALVRSVVPEAFPTKIGNRDVMQAGAFSDRDRAEALLEEFLDLGLNASIEE